MQIKTFKKDVRKWIICCDWLLCTWIHNPKIQEISIVNNCEENQRNFSIHIFLKRINNFLNQPWIGWLLATIKPQNKCFIRTVKWGVLDIWKDNLVEFSRLSLIFKSPLFNIASYGWLLLVRKFSKFESVRFAASAETDYIKMKLHENIRNTLTYVGVCAPPDGTSGVKSKLYMLLGTSIIVYHWTFSTAAMLGAVKIGLISILSAVCDTTCCVNCTFTVFTSFFFRQNLKKLFDKLQDNYEQCSIASR